MVEESYYLLIELETSARDSTPTDPRPGNARAKSRVRAKRSLVAFEAHLLALNFEVKFSLMILAYS